MVRTEFCCKLSRVFLRIFLPQKMRSQIFSDKSSLVRSVKIGQICPSAYFDKGCQIICMWICHLKNVDYFHPQDLCPTTDESKRNGLLTLGEGELNRIYKIGKVYETMLTRG